MLDPREHDAIEKAICHANAHIERGINLASISDAPDALDAVIAEYVQLAETAERKVNLMRVVITRMHKDAPYDQRFSTLLEVLDL